MNDGQRQFARRSPSENRVVHIAGEFDTRYRFSSNIPDAPEYHLQMLSLDRWSANVNRVASRKPALRKEFGRLFIAVVAYVEEAGWAGACHATSAVMHLLLGNLRIPSAVCIGEAALGSIPFDHSWIESAGEVYDAAICSTQYRELNEPPTFRGINLQTLEPAHVRYGITSGQPPGIDALQILNMPFKQFLWGFPGHPEGLWGIAQIIGMRIGLKVDTAELRELHGNTTWTSRYRGLPARNAI